MKFNLSTEHLTLGATDLKLIEEKMERLEKLVQPPFTADVRLDHNRHHRRGKIITCRLNIKQGRRVLHAERSGDTIQNAIDGAITALKVELRKWQDKRKQNKNKEERITKQATR